MSSHRKVCIIGGPPRVERNVGENPCRQRVRDEHKVDIPMMVRTACLGIAIPGQVFIFKVGAGSHSTCDKASLGAMGPQVILSSQNKIPVSASDSSLLRHFPG
jgi:hypothetical protein